MKTIMVAAMLGLMALGVAQAEQKQVRESADEAIKAESKSNAINEISYDAGSKTLTLVFDRGTYAYKDVPAEIYQALLDSPSQGVYYRENIRGKYTATKLSAASSAATGQSSP